MDDDYGDLHNAQLTFSKNSLPESVNKDDDFDKHTVYLGESVDSLVVLTCPADSNISEWKSRIKLVAGHGSFSQTDKDSSVPKTNINSLSQPTDNSSDGFITCQVTSTFNKSFFKRDFSPSVSQKSSSFFQDEKTYVFPVKSVLTNISGQCKTVKLIVTVWLCISPKKVCREQEAKKDFQVCHLVQLRKKIVQQKILTKELTVINPPSLSVRHVTTGDKQLLLFQVHNSTGYSLQLHSLCILPNRETGHGDTNGKLGSAAEKSDCNPVVPISQMSYPVELLSCEKLSYVFHLTPPYVEADAVPVDLVLKAHLTWSQKKETEVVTLYSLPTLSVHRAPFTVSVVCKEEPKIGENFVMSYRIANNLQDFLSMKLYWNLDAQWDAVKHLDDENPQKKHVAQMRNGVVCHDPDIQIGTCPMGCTVPVDVAFQLLQPGLFEFGEFMKVNLRYALPDGQSAAKRDSAGTPASMETVSTLSTEDELAASTELWRHRSGSTTSLHAPMTLSAEDRRRSFATKSYSFGDLGPNVSTESEEQHKIRFKSVKRSTAVHPRHLSPAHPSLAQSDKDVTNPSNFLKKPCKIYIPQFVQ